MPAKLPYKIRHRPDLLERMADAIGEDAYRGGHDGRPNLAIVLGSKARSTTLKVLTGVHEPSADFVATASKRHAANKNVSEKDAFADLFYFVRVAVDFEDTQSADKLLKAVEVAQ